MINMSTHMSEWFVYVLTSESIEATYVGISTDVARRLVQHNGGSPGGARSTRRGRPWKVGAVCGPMESRGDALQLEYRIKASTGSERLEVANAFRGSRTDGSGSR